LYTINIVHKNKVPLKNSKYYYLSERGIKINENKNKDTSLLKINSWGSDFDYNKIATRV